MEAKNQDRLRAAIRDLAIIDEAGQLSQLVIDHANECRRLQLPSDEQFARHCQPISAIRARDIARAAEALFGVPTTECEAIAREVLTLYPRREVALELIEEYAGRNPTAPKRRRAW